eukprot:12843254-Alexandrium_andersonii.AAC.1
MPKAEVQARGAPLNKRPFYTVVDPPATGAERLAVLGFYIDAAPRSKSDSFYAFCWDGAFSARGHLATVLRRRGLCACGCGGRCSSQGVIA